MRRLTLTGAIAVVMALGVAGPAGADPPTQACNGLDQAHEQVHSSGTQGELRLHDLRGANHCSH